MGEVVLESTAVEVVREFWRLMATNEFTAVGAVLGPEFVLEWPQSSERIRGAERFARMNAEYPAHGRWSFTINRLVGGESEAVSDVTVSGGVQTARAISFFEVRRGKIVRVVEFWPEPYEAPANRAHLVESMK
jgi:ketosteroid isomerase-like protein